MKMIQKCVRIRSDFSCELNLWKEIEHFLAFLDQNEKLSALKILIVLCLLFGDPDLFLIVF